MTFLPYVNQDYLFRRKGTVEDPYIDLTQIVTVRRNKVTLLEFPDHVYGCHITDSNGMQLTSTNVLEVGLNEYRVDYTNGIIYFNDAREEEKMTVKYKGCGQFFISSSRILFDTNVENGESLTVQDIIDNQIDIHTDIVATQDTLEIVKNDLQYITNRINEVGLPTFADIDNSVVAAKEELTIDFNNKANVLHSRVDGVISEKDAIKADIVNVHADISGLVDTVTLNKTTTDDKLTLHDGKFTTIEQDITGIHTNLSNVNNALLDAQDDIVVLQNAISTDTNSQNVKFTEYDGKFSTVDQSIADINLKINTLTDKENTDVASLSGRIDSVNASVSEINYISQEVKDNVDLLTIKYESLNGLINEVDTNAKTSIEQFRVDTDGRFTTVTDSFNSQITQLNNTVNTKFAEIDTELDGHQTRLNGLDVEVDALQAETIRLGEKDIELTNTMNRIDSKFTQQLGNLTTLITQFSELITSVRKEMTSQFETVNGQLTTINSSITELNGKVNTLRTDVDGLIANSTTVQS